MRGKSIILALMAMLMAMLLLVAGLGASAVLASSDTQKDSTLTVLVKTREVRVVDLGPRGPTHGDLRVTNAPLLNAAGTKVIGRLDSLCVLTDPKDEPGETAHMTECMVTFSLPGGEITVQGVRAYSTLSGLSPQWVNAVTGGTGAYEGVKGQLHVVTRGTTTVNTFHFIR